MKICLYCYLPLSDECWDGACCRYELLDDGTWKKHVVRKDKPLPARNSYGA